MAGETTASGTISENSKLPLRLVALIVGAVASGVVWLQTVIYGLRGDIIALQTEVKAMSASMDASSSDRWKMIDMEMWVEMLRVKNPSIVVPEAVRRR